MRNRPETARERALRPVRGAGLPNSACTVNAECDSSARTDDEHAGNDQADFDQDAASIQVSSLGSWSSM
jgi:hypothetical protein